MAKKCTQCLIENPQKVANARARGLCKRHISLADNPDKLVICRVCKDTYAENPKYVLQGRYCMDHQSVKHTKKCFECVRLKVPEPNAVQRHNLCVSHGGANYCKVCLDENREEPHQAAQNGVCREHGAKKNFCTECIKQGVDEPKEVQKSGLCVSHGGVTYCSVCLEEDVKNPKKVKFQGMCQAHYTKSLKN
jgi:hypothetical protein